MYLDRLIHLTGAVVVEYITISASQIFLFLIILLDILNIAAFSASVLKVLGGLSWTTRTVSICSEYKRKPFCIWLLYYIKTVWSSF